MSENTFSNFLLAPLAISFKTSNIISCLRKYQFFSLTPLAICFQSLWMYSQALEKDFSKYFSNHFEFNLICPRTGSKFFRSLCWRDIFAVISNLTYIQKKAQISFIRSLRSRFFLATLNLISYPRKSSYCFLARSARDIFTIILKLFSCSRKKDSQNFFARSARDILLPITALKLISFLNFLSEFWVRILASRASGTGILQKICEGHFGMPWGAWGYIATENVFFFLS